MFIDRLSSQEVDPCKSSLCAGPELSETGLCFVTLREKVLKNFSHLFSDEEDNSPVLEVVLVS